MINNLRAFWVCFAISFLSAPAFAQIITQEYETILKTNVLILRSVQQWSLTLEAKTGRPKQTNNYTCTYYTLFDKKDSRSGMYFSYARKFYTSPLFRHLHFFISPYAKVIYRDVSEKGNWFISERDFYSVSIAAGGSAGVQAIVFKRMSIELVEGIGLGAVLWQRAFSTYGRAFPVHVDGLSMIQVGYKF